MTVGDFLGEVRQLYGRYGVRGLKYNAQDLWHGLLSRLGFWANYGTDVYDLEWDLLVVLDACRWDLMEEVAGEYEWVETADPVFSEASHSREWMHKTFMDGPSGLDRLRAWGRILVDPDSTDVVDDHWEMDEGRASGVAHVTWNQFSSVLDPDSFSYFRSFGEEEWDGGGSYIGPRPITDTAIEQMRSGGHDRAVVHYMQPHTPFSGSDGVEVGGSVWERIQRGEKDRDEAWGEYRDALRMVMDDVGLLLESVDAERVVVTADHGNAVGELGCYGHRPYVSLPAVKRVPLLTAKAEDTGSYEPDPPGRSGAGGAELEERLEDLGYR